MNKKQLIGIIGAVLVLVISLFLPAVGEISQVGMRTIGMLAAFLILLVTEALPVVVISLIFCAIMPLLGVVPSFGKALSGYAEPIVFFTLASFGDDVRSKRPLFSIFCSSPVTLERRISKCSSRSFW